MKQISEVTCSPMHTAECVCFLFPLPLLSICKLEGVFTRDNHPATTVNLIVCEHHLSAIEKFRTLKMYIAYTSLVQTINMKTMSSVVF